MVEALNHASIANNVGVDIRWLSAEDLETEEPDKLLAGVHGIVVPGGFGNRGTTGKMHAIRYARERDIPYLGLCLGMQLAAVEFTRQVLGLEQAHSTELDPDTPDPSTSTKGRNRLHSGDMRRGKHRQLVPGTKTYAAYGQPKIEERYRHRFRLNNNYRQLLEERLKWPARPPTAAW